MVLALLALGACVAAMVVVSVWDRRSTMRPATASSQRRQPNDA
jgi:Flp pilus assembly protein CpaB